KEHPHKKTPSKKRTSAKQLHKELKEKNDLLEEVKEERDEYKDKYLRNLAEIDNFRKRVKKEKEEYQKYVLSEFLLDLIQVYDNLERALKAKTPAQKDHSVLTLLVSEDENSIISGVQMIYKQFSDLLKKYNVVEIDALGKHFDPNVHQALSKEEREGINEPIVIEVYQQGFMYNDKLLKPTLVKVAIPKEEEEEEEKEMDTDTDPDYQEEVEE
ncbi:nucleotide exchange factor GrpE, partial [Acidobacteriota bacterium]